jgi:hypothetical protein
MAVAVTPHPSNTDREKRAGEKTLPAITIEHDRHAHVHLKSKQKQSASRTQHGNRRSRR